MLIERVNKRVSVPLARRLKGVKWITPDFVSFLALSGSLLSASVVASFGAGVIPALLFYLSNFLDSLDGDLARERGESSRRGAFLDAVFDRIADISILFALAYYTNEWFWGYLSVLGSVLIPYERAKAEALGSSIEALGTFGSRDIRNFFIFLGLLLGFDKELLVLIAFLTLASSIDRFVKAWRELE